MARIASFTSAGTPVGNRGTLAELMAKRKMLADQQGELMAPRQIEHPMQGFAQLAQAAVNGFQQRRAAQEETAGREQLAGAMSGIDWTKGGPSPEQLHSILTLDPEAGQRLMEQAGNRALEEMKYKRGIERSDFEFGRSNADQIADEKRQAEAAAGVETNKRAEAERIRLANEEAAKQGKQVKIVTGADAEALGYDGKRTWEIPVQGGAAKDITVEQTGVKTVTGPEAQALGYDPTQTWEIPEAGGPAKNITVKPAEPGSPAGQLEKDIADGIFGDPKDPANAERIAEARKTVQKTGANITRDQVWKMQDAYVNSSSALSELQEAQQLLKQGIDFGYLVNLRQGIAKSGWGGDPELAKRTDRYNKIMSREAITAMANTLAGADSDKDMQRFLFILNDETADPSVRGAALDGLIAKTTSNQELQRNRILEGGGEVPQVRGANDEATELAEAQAAIEKGADPNMVRKRFADKGFDPSKLKDKAGY